MASTPSPASRHFRRLTLLDGGGSIVGPNKSPSSTSSVQISTTSIISSSPVQSPVSSSGTGAYNNNQQQQQQQPHSPSPLVRRGSLQQNRRQYSISYNSTPSTPLREGTTLPSPVVVVPVAVLPAQSPLAGHAVGKRRPRPLSLSIANHSHTLSDGSDGTTLIEENEPGKDNGGPHSAQPRFGSHARTESVASPGATLTLAETYAPLLQFIAQKESKCLELRSQLAQHEQELAVLKRKWEKIVSRERAYGHQSKASGSITATQPPKLQNRMKVEKLSTSSASASSSSTPSRRPSSSTSTSSSPQTDSRSSIDSSASTGVTTPDCSGETSFESSLEMDGIVVHRPPKKDSTTPSAVEGSLSSPGAINSRPLSSYLASIPTSLANVDINSAVDKILYPNISSLSKNLDLNGAMNGAMDKILTPRQQKRASKVWEGVWGAISSAGVGPVAGAGPLDSTVAVSGSGNSSPLKPLYKEMKPLELPMSSSSSSSKSPSPLSPSRTPSLDDELITFSPSSWITRDQPPSPMLRLGSATAESILEEQDEEDTITSRVLSPTRATRIVLPAQGPPPPSPLSLAQKPPPPQKEEEELEWNW